MVSASLKVSWIDRSFLLLPVKSIPIRWEHWLPSQTAKEPRLISLLLAFLLSFPPWVVWISKWESEHSFASLLLQIACSWDFSLPSISSKTITPKSRSHGSRTKTTTQEFQLVRPTFPPNSLRMKSYSYSSSVLEISYKLCPLLPSWCGREFHWSSINLLICLFSFVWCPCINGLRFCNRWSSFDYFLTPTSTSGSSTPQSLQKASMNGLKRSITMSLRQLLVIQLSLKCSWWLVLLPWATILVFLAV